MKLKDILRPEQLAERLDVEVETVLGWREIGMPWVTIGKKIYVLESSFMKWVKSREKGTNAQDAPEQEFFGKSMVEVSPPKN